MEEKLLEIKWSIRRGYISFPDSYWAFLSINKFFFSFNRCIFRCRYQIWNQNFSDGISLSYRKKKNVKIIIIKHKFWSIFRCQHMKLVFFIAIILFFAAEIIYENSFLICVLHFRWVYNNFKFSIKIVKKMFIIIHTVIKYWIMKSGGCEYRTKFN